MYKELRIVSVKDLLQEPLRIPNYQRPYKWTTESANTLFSDMYSAFCKGLPEYRIGSVVLHFENNSFNIVDGQQRLTTLSILLYVFSKCDEVIAPSEYETMTKLLMAENTFDENSEKAIIDNYTVLTQKCREFDKETLSAFANYVLNSCTLVKIVTESEQDAFQFFDSQNSRGKALAPHDLLKSYHLREVNDIPEDYDEDTEYPLVMYIPDSSGADLSSEEIASQYYGAAVWASEEEQQKHPAFVLVPAYTGTHFLVSSTRSIKL
mgnify:CR=1 FL=1